MDHAYGRSARYYDRIYGDKAYADEARALLRLIPDDAKTLLEVGCGTGGHLVHLREHLTCEGIDLSEEMLAVARDKLPDMPLAKADMRTFSLGRTFDVVASLFSAIGYVRSEAELDQAIATMAGHLSPGGMLLVEPWLPPEQYKAGGKIHSEYVDEPDLKILRLCISEQRGPFAVTPMHHTIATLDGVEHFVETHELLLLPPARYEQALQAAGLDNVHHVPDVFVRGAWVGTQP